MSTLVLVLLVYPGRTRGEGAAYEWDSQGKTGKGRMTVVESHRRVLDRERRPGDEHHVDQMVGGEFAKGLTSLKQQVEA